jgi:hypothetical protein
MCRIEAGLVPYQRLFWRERSRTIRGRVGEIVILRASAPEASANGPRASSWVQVYLLVEHM